MKPAIKFVVTYGLMMLITDILVRRPFHIEELARNPETIGLAVAYGFLLVGELLACFAVIKGKHAD